MHRIDESRPKASLRESCNATSLIILSARSVTPDVNHRFKIARKLPILFKDVDFGRRHLVLVRNNPERWLKSRAGGQFRAHFKITKLLQETSPLGSVDDSNPLRHLPTASRRASIRRMPFSTTNGSLQDCKPGVAKITVPWSMSHPASSRPPCRYIKLVEVLAKPKFAASKRATS
jgi:hypothetical protein